MTNVFIANLRIVETGRTKGKSSLWRSLEEDMSVLVLKSTNTSTVAQDKACFSSRKSCSSHKSQ
eukprot:1145603-Pelagomonas_calceolata.AAC.2